MNTEFKQTIFHLPGTKLTPEVVLHRTLTKLPRIKSVSILIQWDDNTFDIDHSRQTISELCMSSMIFSDYVTESLKGES